MSLRKLFANVFSNWTNLVISVLIAFIVSPILVSRLGDELYGIWVLIISVTGYFTVLDLGVNSAVIRFISRHEAAGEREQSQQVFSTSMRLFQIVGLITGAITLAFIPLFLKLFGDTDYPTQRIVIVFAIIGVDVAIGFVISVYIAALKATQDFVRVNAVAVTARLLKNIFIVWALFSGYSLLTLGAIHFGETMFRLLSYRWILRGEFRFRKEAWSRPLLGSLMNYSVYSLIISVVTKIIFYTDSILVGSLVSISWVPFYSIPVTLLLYLERLVYAMISVLTPIVSSNEARADHSANQAIYRFGTRYSLILIVPVLTSLYLYGGRFISIWMGPKYGAISEPVLQVLCIGYLAYASQIIANGVLKGISRHQVFAWILVGEAIVNLVLSIALATRYGILGIALGATISLTLANLIFVPFYTCRVLGLSYLRYMAQSYGVPLLMAVPVFGLDRWLQPQIDSYSKFFGISAAIGIGYLAVGFMVLVDPVHRRPLLAKFRR